MTVDVARQARIVAPRLPDGLDTPALVIDLDVVHLCRRLVLFLNERPDLTACFAPRLDLGLLLDRGILQADPRLSCSGPPHHRPTQPQRPAT